MRRNHTSGDPNARSVALGVDVWLANPDDFDDDDLLDGASSPLSTAERERARRFRHAPSRSSYLVGRLLARTGLSRVAAEAPAQWQIVVGEHGKPRLGPAHASLDLRFNLSHTNPPLEWSTGAPPALVACAVCRGRSIGVDIEDVRRRSETDNIAHRFFSEREVAAFFALPSAARRERFYELWTLKEAYIKARGKGMAIPLGAFSFGLDSPRQIQFEATPETRDDRRWHFALFAASADHLLALAVERVEREDDAERLSVSAHRMNASLDFEPVELKPLRQT